MEDNKVEVVKSLPVTQNATVAPVQPQVQLPIGWSYANQKSMENVRKARSAANMKHGMYSGVPIVCQGQDCPFRGTCWIPDADLEVGARCPIEIGAIMERYNSYEKELGIKDIDTVDQGLLKDLIDIEILMLRADNSLAISGDFIEEVVAGTDANGRAIKRPELHKAFEAKSRLRQERMKILSQLNSTRKDKKENVAGLTDPSSVASALMAKLRKLQEEGNVIDVTPKEVTELNKEVTEDESKESKESKE